MGCPLGKIAYEAGQEKFILSKLVEEYPETKFWAVVDDVDSAWEVEENISEQEAIKVIKKIKAYRERKKELYATLNLRLVVEKGNILLPVNFPLEPDHPEMEGLNATKEGVKANGIPIGRKSYVENFLEEKFEVIANYVGKVATLGNTDPQMATRILSESCNKGFDYIAKAIDPKVMNQAVGMTFDALVQEVQTNILRVNDDLPVVGHWGLLEVTQHIFEMPVRDGGFGLTPITVKAPASYMATIEMMRGNKELKDELELFGKEIYSTHDELQALVRGNEKVKNEMRGVIPEKANELFRRRSERQLHNRKPVANQLTNLIMSGRLSALLKRVAFQPESLALAEEDVIRILTILLRSQVTRVLKVDLTDMSNRVEAQCFKAFFSFYLGQHPPSNGGVICEKPESIEKVVQRCMYGHLAQKEVDRHGNHVVACVSGKESSISTHNRVRDVVVKHLRSMELKAEPEPKTHEVMENLMTKQDCKWFFMKSRLLSKEQEEALKELKDNKLTLMMKATPDGTALSESREKELRERVRELRSNLPDLEGDDGKGIRGDMYVQQRNSKKDYVADFAVIHTLQPGTKGTNHKASSVMLKDMVFEREKGGNIREERSKQSTPLVAAKEQEKKHKYQPLMGLAKRLESSHRRKRRLKFLPLVLSHLGEMSGGWFELEDFLKGYIKHASCFKCKVDGVTPSTRAAQFCKELKDSVMVSLVNGWGEQLLQTGYCLKDGTVGVKG